MADPQATSPEWMRVALMGRHLRYGLATEVERIGMKMLRVDVYQSGGAAPLLTEFYAGPAIFSLTPCIEDVARRWEDNAWNLPDVARLSIPDYPLVLKADDDQPF